MFISHLMKTALLFSAIEDHQIVDMFEYGQQVKLEDGTHWNIASPDVYATVTWSQDDTVVITANHSWFSFYRFDYYLNNTTRGSYVRANLDQSPIPFGAQSHWITSIDRYGGFIFLDDGTRWKVSSSDLYPFQEWAINDYVVFGKNDEWFASCPLIFINVRLKKHVRVTSY